MEFEPEIRANGRTYTLVKTQRGSDIGIYKDNYSYLRIGEPSHISRSLETHKQLLKEGFPVAAVLEEGQLHGMSFYREDSLGDHHFGDLFAQDVKEHGRILDETFQSFVAICELYAEAQLKTAVVKKDWANFENGSHLPRLQEELPEAKEKLDALLVHLKEKLEPFPFVLTHGDFNPFNICPKGIIDFETTFYAPAGYDMASVMEGLEWFPKFGDYEMIQLYHYTPEQKQLYVSAIDAVYQKHSLPKPSDYLDTFNVAKGIWFCTNMGEMPKVQKFRFDRMLQLLA